MLPYMSGAFHAMIIVLLFAASKDARLRYDTFHTSPLPILSNATSVLRTYSTPIPAFLSSAANAFLIITPGLRLISFWNPPFVSKKVRLVFVLDLPYYHITIYLALLIKFVVTTINLNYHIKPNWDMGEKAKTSINIDRETWTSWIKFVVNKTGSARKVSEELEIAILEYMKRHKGNTK